MTTRIERRTQSRKRPVSLVYVELPPANGGMMRDLSEQGFSLRAMMPLKASEKVGFSFILDSATRIDGEAIVVRLEDSGHVAALEFAGLSARARDQIRQWLDTYDESVAKESAKPVAAPAANSTFEELRTEIRSTEARPKAPRVQLPVATKQPLAPPPVEESSPQEAPPLLKLASVRPANLEKSLEDQTPPVAEVEEIEAALPSAVQPEPAPEPEAVPAPPIVVAEPIDVPAPPASREPVPNLPPALEPLSSLEEAAHTASPSWMDNFTLSRAIGIMLLLTLIVGSVVYHREVGHCLVWLGQRIAGDETSEGLKLPAPPLPVALPPATREATPNTDAEPLAKTPQAAPPVADSSSTKSAQLPAASSATPSPQPDDSTSPTAARRNQVARPSAANAPGEAPADGGLQEYQRAQAILHAPGRSAGLSEAVRLLWAAVEKGNVGAEITLAELYRQGRGVNRNCAQAKILLATAARKGSPDAQRRLEALQREGCED